MTRTPMKRRPAKRKNADPEYVAWIHTQPCAAMTNWEGMYDWMLNAPCSSVVEAHHAGDHGFGQRATDRTCIPLCAWHHRNGPDAVHVLGKKFWERFRLDRDTLVRELNERYDKERK